MRRCWGYVVAASVGFWANVALTHWEAHTHNAALRTTHRRRITS